MKYILKINSLFTLIMLFAITAFSQEISKKSVIVPLSKPGEAGKLYVEIHNGSIKVSGYEGKEVIVVSKSKSLESHHNKDKNSEDNPPEGMRVVGNNAYALDIIENENKIKVDTDSHYSSIDLEIQVPHNFALYLENHRDGDIEVDNIKGVEINAESHQGSILLTNVTSPIVADTHHGDIIVTFSDVSSENPSAFNSYNGNIDLTFPKKGNATVKTKSERGNIYTDMAVSVNDSEPKVITKSKNGTNYYSVEKWNYGKINSGGPEFSAATSKGNVYIRVQK
ncbi:DUF4097 family beta strand repeat-containing protein [Flexithrix dorotheae]|uniref:DUF4097 family beta strand repeat-containing protein n=1 Tax=Flexithrix dorotheae TaxID=70993 RepID=UPI0003A1B292|nr:DUF4097 family beta strand repeat-containing protein [Flexithrix dorotheae]